MPNAKVLEEKKRTVEEMTARLKSQSGVFVDYRGITGIEATEMRAKLREENVQYSVIKNSLMKFAIKNVGFEELDSVLSGTTALATSSEDPIAPARVIKEFSDKMPDYFEIKAGFMDGKILTKNEVIAIASILPLPMLQAQFLGTLLAPISKLAVVLKAAAEKGSAAVSTEDSKEPDRPAQKDSAEETKESEKPAAAAAEKPAEKAEQATAEQETVPAQEAKEEPKEEQAETNNETEE